MNGHATSPGGQARVLLLSDSVELAEGLARTCAAHDLELARASDPAAIGAAGAPPPDLVLLDPGAPGMVAAIPRVAETLAALGISPERLVCLAEDGDLGVRLAALRARAADCVPLSLGLLRIAGRLALLAGVKSGPPPRVLVVDDQPVAALFAARVLEAAGMETARCSDPLEVLDLAVRLGPDLVLMDLHMPEASGLELTALLRAEERFADLPIVFLSGELDRERQIDALRLGADDFLAKPAAPDVLVQRVRRGLDRARRRAANQTSLTRLDGETGLADRERLLERLDRQLLSPNPECAGLLYVELGPAGAGLERAAASLVSVVERADLAARVGACALAVLMRRDAPEALPRAADVIVSALRLDLGRSDIGAGLCTLDQAGGDSLTLVSRARKAAQAGSGPVGAAAPVARYVPSLPGSPGTPREPLLEAIRHESFTLLFEPMVSLRGDPRARFEATARVVLADGELLGPRAYAPSVIRARLTPRVDRWMLERGLDAAGEARAAGQAARLFIHQTLEGLAEGDWCARLREGISARDLVRARPVIQLQASDVDHNLDLAARRGRELASLGIDLCVNGFGEGGRGARILDALDIRYARLATDMVRRLPAPRLRDLVAWLHKRNIRVILGGVDAPDAVAGALNAGVDLIQGPFVQPPSPLMDFDFVGAEAGGPD